MSYTLKYFILQILGENSFFFFFFKKILGENSVTFAFTFLSYLLLYEQLICSYLLLAFFIIKSTSIDES